MNERKLFQKQDLIIVAILLLLAIFMLVAYYFYNSNADNVVCRISYDGKHVQTINLSDEREFYLEQNNKILFEVQNGAIAFVESDCPDKVCINSGFIKQAGQMAACLPNRVSIQIISEENSIDADIIAY